jgi:hypothetical protein
VGAEILAVNELIVRGCLGDGAAGARGGLALDQPAAALDAARIQVDAAGEQLQNNISFLSFPYVCPAPVLVTRSFLA